MNAGEASDVLLRDSRHGTPLTKKRHDPLRAGSIVPVRKVPDRGVHMRLARLSADAMQDELRSAGKLFADFAGVAAKLVDDGARSARAFRRTTRHLELMSAGFLSPAGPAHPCDANLRVRGWLPRDSGVDHLVTTGGARRQPVESCERNRTRGLRANS